MDDDTLATQAAIRELTPVLDPSTGQVVWTDVAVSAGQPRPGAARQTPEGAAGDAPATAAMQSLSLESQDGRRSALPHDRMAASDDWDQIAKTLRARENGRGGKDVALQPGGQMVVIDGKTNTAASLSRLPQDRMAASTPGPRAEDVNALRRLDPRNVERWEAVHSASLSGWTFRLRPMPSAPTYCFFAFRSPSDGGTWRISVLAPNMDDQRGHSPHMWVTDVGGTKVPVICGPEGMAARDLAEVRTHAAKWMAYTERRRRGEDPRFSL